MPALISIPELARDLGFGVAALEKVAIANGFVIQCGSRKKIRSDEIEGLIEACRVQPKVPAYTNASEKVDHKSGLSGMRAGSKYRPAQNAAARLKQHSRTTSTPETGQVVQLTLEQ